MKPGHLMFNLKKNTISVCGLLMVLFMVAGCSSVSNIVQKTKDVSLKFKSSDSVLKKKIGIVSFQNASGIKDDDFVRLLWAHMTESVESKCTNTIWVVPDTGEYTQFLAEPPKHPSGLIDNLSLAEKGRQIGLNGIVMPTLTNINHEKRKSGFLWFKKSRELIQLKIKIEVFDTHTGAKILYQSYMQELDIEPSEAGMISEGNMLGLPSLKDAVDKVSKTIASQICKTIASQPWKGYVISANRDNVILSSGKDIGIKTGDVFKVYDIHGTIDGREGNRYLIPGIQTDELKITSVTPDNAVGISISGKNIAVDSIVQIKEK